MLEAEKPSTAIKHTDAAELRTAVETAHARMTQVQGGNNADYIPYLASVPSDLAGVALMTREGELVPGANAEERWKNILDMQSRLAGRQIMISEEVNQSEQTTNYHNRAIAWMLYAAGSCYSDPIEALDIYTRQCSTLITATDLAMIGATLANGGVNPKTGERVISAANVSHILAEMMMGTASEAWQRSDPSRTICVSTSSDMRTPGLRGRGVPGQGAPPR